MLRRALLLLRRAECRPLRRWVDPKLNGDVPAMVEALQGVDVLTSILPNIVEISAQLPDLKLIQIQAAGYDEFTGGGPDVLEGLRQNDVMLANNGGSNAVGVAETTIMLMLGVCKNMFELAIMARAGRWTKHHTQIDVRGAPGARELSSQTIGIVGFGNIGRMVARNLQGFRCKVLYYDREELMVGRDGELDAEAVSFEELLRRSDIVTVHVPNQPSTNGMITGKKLFGKEQFDMMKESVRPISGSSPHCLHSRLLTRRRVLDMCRPSTSPPAEGPSRTTRPSSTRSTPAAFMAPDSMSSPRTPTQTPRSWTWTT